MDSVVEARILRKVSDTEYIMYSHLGTPPTMKDREFVMDVTLAVNVPAQSVTVTMRSVDDPAAPKTGYVRAILTDSVFVLTPAAGGNGTHVVAEIHCDPKGSVPSWIVNLFQRGWGYNTIKSLRKQVAKPGIPVPELLRNYLEGRAGSQAAN
jgi:START domain